MGRWNVTHNPSVKLCNVQLFTNCYSSNTRDKQKIIHMATQSCPKTHLINASYQRQPLNHLAYNPLQKRCRTNRDQINPCNHGNIQLSSHLISIKISAKCRPKALNKWITYKYLRINLLYVYCVQSEYHNIIIMRTQNQQQPHQCVATNKYSSGSIEFINQYKIVSIRTSTFA